jgi:hypothetical protein
VSVAARSTVGQPRREDLGGLIVLHMYGSYRQMGRQQVELLGPVARDLYEFQLADWKRLISGFGVLAKLLDRVLPRFWMSTGPRHDRSGLYEEIRGYADGLGVSASDAWRGAFGVLGSGTTTFVATRTATADGSAIIGKNSDWTDSDGRRPPVVSWYHPDNGDLDFILAGWPLLPSPATGINEAGFALGLNFFTADHVLGLGMPEWPYRRALQKATTVEEGVRMITGSAKRGISGFISIADAKGDIAMIECTPGECAVRPAGDWFAQSNHARTEKMIPHDRGRFADSFQRLAAMEEAVRSHLGRISPEIAAGILRDRSNSPYANESVVANAVALNSTVVQTSTRTLWHSKAKQPQAPFGEMVPFSVAGEAPAAPSLPADPRLGGPEMEREAAALAAARRGVRLFGEGKVEEAGAIWDRLAGDGEPALEPHRLAWAQARVRWSLGRLEEADGLLTGLDTDAVPFDVRSHALVVRAVIADRLARRKDALRLYQQAQAYLDAHDYNHQSMVAPLRARIAAGLRRAQDEGPMPESPDLQRVG